MRTALVWIVVIVVGVVVVLGVSAAIGHRDDKGQTVPAGDYAQNVCGAVGTWRGEMKSIVREIRIPPAFGSLGDEEPQSETPQGRTGLIRSGLQESVRAAKTLVEGIENAGTPDSPQGTTAATKVSDWADSSRDALESADNALGTKPDTLEDAVTQLAGAAGAIRLTLATGKQTLADVARLDPQLTAAFKSSSTCQQLTKEQTTT